MKSDFPIFQTHPSLVYLDSGATTQKPAVVIDAIGDYLRTTNSNIHRGNYEIAEESEDLYRESKEKYSSLIGAKAEEIIYTYNATYAFNMIAQSLVISNQLKKDDIILIPLREHHANIVPRQMVAKQYGCRIEFINITDDYKIDRDDFRTKYTSRVKVVAMSMCSNVTGSIVDVQKAKKIINESTLLVIDGSQLVSKRPINVQTLGCDVFIATAHKMYAMTGLGMLYIRKDLMMQLTPPWGGGGMISDVTTTGFTIQPGRDGREPGTPHVVGAVSLGTAIDYINHVGGETIVDHDQKLSKYFLSHYHEKLSSQRHLIGHDIVDERVGIFSLVNKDPSYNITRTGDLLALQDIAVRTGGHCTHPYRHKLGFNGSLRISLAYYNTTDDIKRCIDQLSKD